MTAAAAGKRRETIPVRFYDHSRARATYLTNRDLRTLSLAGTDTGFGEGPPLCQVLASSRCFALGSAQRNNFRRRSTPVNYPGHLF